MIAVADRPDSANRKMGFSARPRKAASRPARTTFASRQDRRGSQGRRTTPIASCPCRRARPMSRDTATKARLQLKQSKPAFWKNLPIDRPWAANPYRRLDTQDCADGHRPQEQCRRRQLASAGLSKIGEHSAAPCFCLVRAEAPLFR